MPRLHMFSRRQIEWLPKEISDQVGPSRCDDPARVQRDVYFARLNGARTPQRGVPTWKQFLAIAIALLLLAFVMSHSLHAADWVRAGLTTNQPMWGLRNGLQFALPPGGFTGGDGGPRGLIRLGYPTLTNGGYDLINFIAIEPVVGQSRGLSELEKSRIDGRPGKLLTAGRALLTNTASVVLLPGEVSSPTAGVEELAVPLRVERFENGAHVRLMLRQRSDRPDELRLTVQAEPDSAPMKSCILTATMGNKARARLLWLKDGPVSSLKIFGNYTGADFTPHAFFPLDRLPRASNDDVLIPVTTDESDPAKATGLSRFWQYRGERITQYWRKPAAQASDSLRCAVNARFKYWMSQNPIPNGLAYENFELVEDFKDGQEFIFGITRQPPEELLKR